MANKVGRRRAPIKYQPYAGILQRITKKAGPEYVKELEQFARLLEQQFDSVAQETYNAAPAPHTHEDDASGGSLDSNDLLSWVALHRADC